MPFYCQSCCRFYLGVIGLYGLLFSIVRADIVTDGTVGPAQALPGPVFVIPESLGSRSGTNLFHSFQRFNIASGEQATFTGSMDISNVISRVTGGQISNINGLLRSTISQADFYFINPAGVVFGANAQIDVPASFYVSTADELRFPDGSVYNATNPSVSTLSIDQPEAFGFLGDQTANIAINQSELVINSGNTLSLSSSELKIDNAQIRIDAGEVQIAAVGANTATITVSGNVSESAQGLLSINNSKIDVAGNGAGSVLVRSGASEIRSSSIFADNTGIIDAGLEQGINIWADSLTIFDSLILADSLEQSRQAPDVIVTTSNDLSVLNGSVISSSAFANGNAGNVIVNAGQLTIDSQGNSEVTAILSQAAGSGSGDAGNVNVNVGNTLSIINAGFIGASAFSEGGGNAGNVIVNADQLLIDGQRSDFSTGIFSDAASGSRGQAGTVSVNVNDALSIRDGGAIRSSAFSDTDAGEVTVNSDGLIIDSQGSTLITGIGSDSVSGSGGAGIVNVNVKNSLSLFGDGTISSNTLTVGDAGNVSVNAKQLVIDGKDAQLQASIGSSAFPGSQGNAGTVTVKVEDTLSLIRGSTITTATFADGDAGNINVEAGQLLIDVQEQQVDTGIFSQTQPGSGGNSGNIIVKVKDTLSIANTGLISTNTQGLGHGGNISVQSASLTLDGGNSSLFTGIVSSASNTSAGQTGNISVNTQTLLINNGATLSIESFPTVNTVTLATINPTKININAENITLTNSSITTESSGNAPAGSISLNVADTLSLDPSNISTAANNANGGAISIQAKVIDLQDSQITTSVKGQGDGGDIGLTTDVLVLDSGFVQANTEGADARGGDIRINTDALVASHNRLLSGGDTPLGFQTGLNVIQAAAPKGVSGNIDITSPQLDISGELTDLESAFLDLDDLVQDPCATPGGRQSTLTTLGRGGLPESPDQAGSIVITPERLKRLLPLVDTSSEPHSGLLYPITKDHVESTVAKQRLQAQAEPECQP